MVVSRARPASVIHASVGSGQTVTEGEADVVVGPEVGVEAQLLGEECDRELVVVGRPLLGFGEDPEAHRSFLPGAVRRSAEYARAVGVREQVYDVTNSVGDKLLKGVNRAIGRQSELPLRPFYDPADFSWVAPLEANWKAIRAELDEVLAYRTRCRTSRTSRVDQSQPHRRRPLEDLLLLRLRLQSDANCARCPETTRLIEAHPRHGDRDVLDPRARQAHPAARRPLQGRAALPPRSHRARGTGGAVRHPGGSRDPRGGARARAWCSTTPSSTRRGTRPTRTRVVLFVDVVRPAAPAR